MNSSVFNWRLKDASEDNDVRDLDRLFHCLLYASYKTTEHQYRANKFTWALLIVLLKDDKLLKSTMEGGKLFQIRAVRSEKKWRLTFMRINLISRIVWITCSRRGIISYCKEIWRLNINKHKNNYVYDHHSSSHCLTSDATVPCRLAVSI